VSTQGLFVRSALLTNFSGILSQRAAIGTNVSVDCQINRLTIVTGLIETKETLKDLKVIAKEYELSLVLKSND
jgi:hypothetical protein